MLESDTLGLATLFSGNDKNALVWYNKYNNSNSMLIYLFTMLKKHIELKR